MFMDLERILPGGVRVISIEPKQVQGRVQVKLSVGTSSDEAKLKFLRALEDSKEFTDIELQNEHAPRPAPARRPESHTIDCRVFEDLMPRDVTFRKRATLGAVIFLVLADVALAAYSWELASAPRTPRQQLAVEMKQLDLLKADIRRAQDIREKIPAIQKDCDKFEQSLFRRKFGLLLRHLGTWRYR